MKCIIMGANGREAVIAEKLSEKFEIYAVLSHKNPTIIEIVNKTGGKYLIDKKYNKEKIREFIRNNKIEICFVNSDNLLEQGLIDLAKEMGLKTFGPNREGAKIEWSKSYAISLVKKIAPEFLVNTHIITNLNELNEAMKEYSSNNFVVKPDILTGGKGVKVGGVHFQTRNDGFNYAKSCLQRDGIVILQDKIIGNEFTIMGFTNGEDVICAPCTYDYPYRYDNDKGPGTGGMGCVSLKNGLLPFLTKEDIKKCKNLMQKVIREMNKESINFNGVLNAGFFKNDKGIFYMEFNSRLGDPEVMNLLNLLESSFPDVVYKIVTNQKIEDEDIKFKKLYSYLVYIVSKNYAVHSDAEPIEFNLNEETIKNNKDIKLYCSSMEKLEDNRYISIGNSRLFAVLKIGENLNNIKSEVDSIIKKLVNGIDGLEYRKDIGIMNFKKGEL